MRSLVGSAVVMSVSVVQRTHSKTRNAPRSLEPIVSLTVIVLPWGEIPMVALDDHVNALLVTIGTTR